ncbi:MAG: hypothetical protein R3C61_27570 [Bacteroidia bacterium]
MRRKKKRPEAKVERDRRQSLFVVNEFAARYFHEQLTQNPKGIQIGHSYFKERVSSTLPLKNFNWGIVSMNGMLSRRPLRKKCIRKTT